MEDNDKAADPSVPKAEEACRAFDAEKFLPWPKDDRMAPAEQVQNLIRQKEKKQKKRFLYYFCNVRCIVPGLLMIRASPRRSRRRTKIFRSDPAALLRQES